MITEFALYLFTTLGGTAAGLYAASAVFPMRGKKANLAVAIIPLALLAIGGCALLLHLGHPERMFNAFHNPQAGITMEGYAGMAFGAVVVIDLLLTWFKGSTPRAVRCIGALCGLALCFVMGLTYFNYISMPEWHQPITLCFFLLVDVAAGFALAGAINQQVDQTHAFNAVTIALALVAAVVIAVEGATFGSFGFSVTPFAIGAVLAIAAAVVAVFARKRSDAKLYWAVFACLFIGMAVARYAFYAAL